MKSIEDLFAFSIVIAGIIALVKYRNIEKLFLPFIGFVWLAAGNDVLSYWLMKNGYHTAINNNIYVLAEGLLLFTFMKKIRGLEYETPPYKIYLAVLVIIWLIENILMGRITGVSSVFRIVCSLLLVFTAISLLSKILMFGLMSTDLDTNRRSIVLICTGVIIYFTFKLLIEIFWLYGLTKSKEFRMNLYDILIYINLFSNVLYAIALLWIRKKSHYIRLF